MHVNTDLANTDIRLIAFDLDGTLLNSDKVLTPRNREALEHAAGKGILIVPTTGRLFKGIPSEIRQFPFLRYAVTINGAAVFDTETGDNLYRAEIPPEKAIEIMTYLDQFPVIYDCYKDNTGWMTQSMWDQAEIFAPNGWASWVAEWHCPWCWMWPRSQLLPGNGPARPSPSAAPTPSTRRRGAIRLARPWCLRPRLRCWRAPSPCDSRWWMRDISETWR